MHLFSLKPDGINTRFYPDFTNDLHYGTEIVVKYVESEKTLSPKFALIITLK